jgi:lipopolysaccharide transport system permease protein
MKIEPQPLETEDQLAPAVAPLSAARPLKAERQPGHVSPRTPSILIGRRRDSLDVGELWAHRELFYILTWRDIKVRYKQSLLGVTWVILQPLLTMAIFTLLFGRLAKMPSEGQPYPIFSYAGLLPWTFFSTAVTNSSNSLVANTNLITKVYLPRLLIPIAATAAPLLDLAIASLILFVIMPWYGVALHLNLLLLLPLVALTVVVASSVGIFTSAMNVKFRDIRHALPFVIQIWMFVTPVIYPVSFLPARWRWLLYLNPLAGIIDGFRAAIFARAPEWSILGSSVVVSVILIATTVYFFRRMERQFADVI